MLDSWDSSEAEWFFEWDASEADFQEKLNDLKKWEPMLCQMRLAALRMAVAEAKGVLEDEMLNHKFERNDRKTVAEQVNVMTQFVFRYEHDPAECGAADVSELA